MQLFLKTERAKRYTLLLTLQKKWPTGSSDWFDISAIFTHSSYIVKVCGEWLNYFKFSNVIVFLFSNIKMKWKWTKKKYGFSCMFSILVYYFEFQFRKKKQKKIHVKCIWNVKLYRLVLFIIFQVDICSESKIQLRFEIAHQFLDLFAFLLDNFDLFDFFFLRSGNQLLCLGQIVRNKYFADNKWDLLVFIKQFDFIGCFFQTFQIIFLDL